MPRLPAPRLAPLLMGLLVPWFAGAAPPAPPADVERLIAGLNDDRIAVRDDADRRLGEMNTVPLALRSALGSDSAEVRRRVKRVVRRIEARLAEGRFAETKRLLDQGYLDRAIEHTIRWQAYDADGVNVKHLANFVERIRRTATDRHKIGPPPFGTDEMSGAKKLEDLVRDTVSFSRGHLVAGRRTDAVLVGAGVEVGAGRNQNLFIVSGESVDFEQPGGAIYFMVLANGNVTMGALARGIIVTEGDVHIGNDVSGAVIVSRGNVSLKTKRVSGAIVLAGGKIAHVVPEGSVKSGLVVLRPNDRTGMGLIKFFEVAQVGLDTAAAPNGAKLKAVGEWSVFAGRLLPGDVVTAIDEDATPDPEKFRRVLRRALAGVGSEVAFHVLRDGKTAKVAVTIPALPAAKAGTPAKP